MYCRVCGEQYETGKPNCPRCKAAAGVGTNYCYNCGERTVPGSAVCPKCGAVLYVNSGYQPGAGQSYQNTNQGPWQQPYYGAPSGYSQKSKLVAGLLGIFLGYIGIHNFYLGFTSRAVLQIVVTVLTCGIGGLWGFIEGILIIAGNIQTDANGVPLRD